MHGSCVLNRKLLRTGFHGCSGTRAHRPCVPTQQTALSVLIGILKPQLKAPQERKNSRAGRKPRCKLPSSLTSHQPTAGRYQTKQNNAGASQSETPALLCCICLSKRLFYTSKQLLISLQLLSRFNQASACPLRFSTRALNSSIVTSLLSIVTALRTASNIFINPTCCAIRERESLSASIRFA